MSALGSWTGEEARAFDQHLQKSIGLPAALLMENAAAALAQTITQIAQEKGFTKILLLCGTGHNGADALVAARHLAGGGLDVRVALPLGLPRALSLGEPALAILPRLGIRAAHPDTPLAELLAGRDLVVDALFGLGLDRPLLGAAARLIQALNAAQRPVLAVDLPSGLDATTGAVWGSAVRATWTLSFVAPKLGFTVGAGPDLAGEVRTAGIGLSAGFADSWVQARRAALRRES